MGRHGSKPLSLYEKILTSQYSSNPSQHILTLAGWSNSCSEDSPAKPRLEEAITFLQTKYSVYTPSIRERARIKEIKKYRYKEETHRREAIATPRYTTPSRTTINPVPADPRTVANAIERYKRDGGVRLSETFFSRFSEQDLMAYVRTLPEDTSIMFRAKHPSLARALDNYRVDLLRYFIQRRAESREVQQPYRPASLRANNDLW